MPDMNEQAVMIRRDGQEFGGHSSHPGLLFSMPWRHRRLILALIARDLAGGYRGYYLGFAWSLFQPLLPLVVYSFFLGRFAGINWLPQGQPLELALFLLLAVTVLHMFTECFNRAPQLMLSHSFLVKRVGFPLEVLPFMITGTALFHALVTVLVLLAFYYYQYGQVHLTAILMPLLLLVCYTSIAGSGLVVECYRRAGAGCEQADHVCGAGIPVHLTGVLYGRCVTAGDAEVPVYQSAYAHHRTVTFAAASRTDPWPGAAGGLFYSRPCFCLAGSCRVPAQPQGFRGYPVSGPAA